MNRPWKAGVWTGRGMLSSALLLVALPAYAQGPGVEAGWYSGSTRSYVVLSAGVGQHLGGPLALTLNGTYLSPDRASGDLIGGAADLTLWRGGNPGLYLVGGVGGGFGLKGASVFWGEYSAGLGYDLRLFAAVGLGIEARWKVLSRRSEHGVQVGIRLGGGMRRAGATASASMPPSSEVAVSGPAGTPWALSVVETAVGAMGTPYAWGGSSANGFDCSGLIQYAFAAHGVSLPRTSAAQAREGVEVERSLTAIAPGDILTFSSGEGGSTVTHVGLYLGGGEFIHSASGGVQRSQLSATDPYGRWWWTRWIGARRVTPA